MGGALRQAGIPPDVVHHDRSTVTTRDQIDWVQRLVDEHRERTGDVTIIASRLQMPRVSALLCAGDLHAAIVSSPTDVEPPTAGPWRFVPTYGALRVSRDALYEHLSMPYYRYKGWIK